MSKDTNDIESGTNTAPENAVITKSWLDTAKSAGITVTANALQLGGSALNSTGQFLAYIGAGGVAARFALGRVADVVDGKDLLGWNVKAKGQIHFGLDYEKKELAGLSFDSPTITTGGPINGADIPHIDMLDLAPASIGAGVALMTASKAWNFTGEEVQKPDFAVSKGTTTSIDVATRRAYLLDMAASGLSKLQNASVAGSTVLLASSQLISQIPTLPDEISIPIRQSKEYNSPEILDVSGNVRITGKVGVGVDTSRLKENIESSLTLNQSLPMIATGIFGGGIAAGYLASKASQNARHYSELTNHLRNAQENGTDPNITAKESFLSKILWTPVDVVAATPSAIVGAASYAYSLIPQLRGKKKEATLPTREGVVYNPNSGWEARLPTQETRMTDGGHSNLSMAVLAASSQLPDSSTPKNDTYVAMNPIAATQKHSAANTLAGS